MTTTKPFIAFILNDKNGTYEVRLVNPTDQNYVRIKAFTGAFIGTDGDLLETSKSVKDLGELSAQSQLLIESDDQDGLDFTIWYHLDLYEENNKKTHKSSFP